MNPPQQLIIALIALFSPCALASPTAATFGSYTKEIQAPQLFFQNKTALEARLKLLDSAPAGGRALISTFLFDNGTAVRLLARHVCLAAERGVSVELLADSKSGSRPGIDDTFDKSDDAQVVEELYQYMTNCGASIHIYNDVESFIEVLGIRLPNIFLDPAVNGKKFTLLEALKVKNRVMDILQKISDLVYAETRAAGIQGDSRPIFNNSKKLLMEFMNLMSVVHESSPNSLTPPLGFNDTKTALERYYRFVITDPFWNKVSAAQLKSVLPNIEKKFKSDPELGRLWQELRRYNRMNHRKLFLVESGKDACAFIGGRNLGDSYLTDNSESFLDGDVLVCKHHSAELAAVVDQLKSAFQDLKSDFADPILGLSSDLEVRTLQPNHSYAFRALIIPSGMGPRAQPTASAPYTGKLRADSRNLLPELRWSDVHAAPGGVALSGARNWKYLRAGLDPTRDEVQASLLKMIAAEKKEVFIESPYAEFDASFRGQIEAALARGVKVHVITNSFFITDGGSKLIRITMANWTEKMLAAYPQLFAVRYVTLDAAHMTHFKGAAFACQAKAQGNMRSFLIGSHNFDPRSGRSEKDHALSWDEPSLCSDLQESTFVSQRYAVYGALSERQKKQSLAAYPDILQELEGVKRSFAGKTGDNRWIAAAMIYMFYTPSGDGFKLNQGETARRLLQLLDEGGIHDLLGRVL